MRRRSLSNKYNSSTKTHIWRERIRWRDRRRRRPWTNAQTETFKIRIMTIHSVLTLSRPTNPWGMFALISTRWKIKASHCCKITPLKTLYSNLLSKKSRLQALCWKVDSEWTCQGSLNPKWNQIWANLTTRARCQSQKSRKFRKTSSTSNRQRHTAVNKNKGRIS